MTQQIIGIGTIPEDDTGDGVRVAFSKTKDNFAELYAGHQPGVFLQNNAHVTFAIPTETKILDWQVEIYDDLGVHSNVVNPSRIVIPAGVSRARFGYALDTQAAAANQSWTVNLLKNGSALAQLVQQNIAASQYGVWGSSIPTFLVSAGDYFEIQIIFTSTVFQGTIVSGITNYATNFWADFFG